MAVLLFLAFVLFIFEKRKNPSVLKQKLHANPFEKAMWIFGAGVGPLYTYLISVAMAPFRCLKQIDGSYTLVPSPNLDCFDAQWNRNLATIMLGLLMVFLIPTFFIYILWKYRPDFSSNVFHFRYGYLVSGVKPKFYWWNILQLCRKTLVVMMIDLTNGSDPFLRTFLVIIIMFGFMHVESLLRPRPETSSSRSFSLL
jgi:hypothetical protein